MLRNIYIKTSDGVQQRLIKWLKFKNKKIRYMLVRDIIFKRHTFGKYVL